MRQRSGIPIRNALTWLLAVACVAAACKKPPASDPTSTTDAGPVAKPDPKGLRVDGVRFIGAGGLRPEAIFARGEQLVLRFLVRGLRSRARKIRLKASLTLRGPDRAVHLRRPGAAGLEQEVPPGKSTEVVELAAQLRLSIASPPGPYEVTLDVRDGISGKHASTKIPFRVMGAPQKPAPQLTLRQFQAAPDEDLLAGLPLNVSLEPAGFAVKATGAAGQERYKAELTGTAELQDGSGVVQGRAKAKLYDGATPFRPLSVPLSWPIPLPAKLPPGSYQLRVTVTDHVGGKTAQALHRFRLLPGGLGIYGLRVEGAGDVARQHFLRGESVTVKMRLHGLARPADFGVDVGLIGPDKGFYLVRKNAHKVKEQGKQGPATRTLDVPLTIPEFAPAGRWRLQLRLRDYAAKRNASRALTFVVTGKPLRPLPNLQVSGLKIRHWQGGPPVTGLLLRAGSTIHLDAVVGGMRLQPEQSYYHRAKLVCTVRLSDRNGKVRATLPNACRVDRRFSFVPLRMRLRAQWTIPAHLMGKHTLQLEVLDELSNRVSVVQRNTFILIPRQKR